MISLSFPASARQEGSILMSPQRCLILLVLSAGFLAVAFGWAQQPPKDKPDQTPAPPPSALLTERKVKRALALAEDCIQQKRWKEAVDVLQSLLDLKEDSFVEETLPIRGGKPAIRWTSVSVAVDRLLTSEAEVLKAYQEQYGAKAKARLEESKGDPAVLAEVAARYPHTDAAVLALDLLGADYLTRHHFAMAAYCYEQLLQRAKAKQISLPMRYRAASAFRHAGDPANAAQVLKDLLPRIGDDGLPLGDRNLSRKQVEEEINQIPLPQTAVFPDWPMFKGNASRSGQGQGSAPFLEHEWYYPTWVQEATHQWLGKAVEFQEQHSLPVLPGFFPIAATVRTNRDTLPLLVYRSHWGIHARNLKKNGKLVWDAPSNWSIDRIVEDTDKKLTADQWQWPSLYLNTHPNLLYENSTIGTLSTDGKYVFLVEDLELPPHPQSDPMQQLDWGQRPSFGKFHEALFHSRLQAFDLESGKFKWELGGRGSEKGDLADCYFLGPPLPLEGKLYVLIDKRSELRLVCLESPKEENRSPTIGWSQPLADVRDKLLLDVGRRLQAVHLSFANGILVGPTNVGAIFGVDILSHNLVWAYSYSEESTSAPADKNLNQAQKQMMNRQRPPTLTTHWKTSAPVIQDGKVVFTAPDSASVHCLNLRTGELAWKEARGEDLYLAGVYHGKVLLVGKTTCRALSLADGKQLWKLETGLPSGQGVASANTYYLPLRAAAVTKEPEVCAIDIDKGVIVAHARSRKKEVPGNLLFADGKVISQTADRITCYQQLGAKLRQIDQALEKNRRDPRGLTERSEMKLARGDLAGAVDDLSVALASKPPADLLPRTRAKLFEALTTLLQRDFNAGEKYLAEYQELCRFTIPADASPEDRKRLAEEQQRRQTNFLVLLGKGREQQGRLEDALQVYMDFGAVAGTRELISSIDDPAIRAPPDIWVQGRITALFARATPEQRKALEARIAAKWKAARDSKDMEAIRRFVTVFGSFGSIGNEARLYLAELLLENSVFLENRGRPVRLRSQLVTSKSQTQRRRAGT
jgi:hypothetical protein